MRQGINLRGYAQKNPKQEYKREAFELFSNMLDQLKLDVIGVLSRVQIRAPEDVEAVEEQRRKADAVAMKFQHEEAEHIGGEVPEDQRARYSVRPIKLVVTILALVVPAKNTSNAMVSSVNSSLG